MPRFAKDQIVRKIADRSVIGRIIQLVEQTIANQQFYVVDIGNRRIRIREDEIEESGNSIDPREQFLASRFGRPEQALLGLTFHRLRANLSNYIYSFNGSRTEFMPHQFKPLIKFLDSPTRRILIADEVGLGKTIEAGIILLEMQARNELRRSLVVCPASLCEKWRVEMLERFELEFQVMTGAPLAECLRQPDSGYRSLFIITSYESLRTERVSDSIAELERPFDIVIADEAHRVRNPYAKTNGAMHVLSGRTDALLLLTATPVNNTSEDLLSLLRLLDDSVFNSDALYDHQIAINSMVMAIERRLRLEPVPYDDLLQELNQLEAKAGSHSAGSVTLGNYAENPYFSRLRQAIEARSIITLDDKVSAQRQAAKLNLLGDYVNRTRRAEVSEFKPVRDPHIGKIAFHDLERGLYDLVRGTATEYFDEFRLPVITFERMASSCMPAFIARFRGEVDAGDEMEAEEALGLAIEEAEGGEDLNIQTSSFQEVAARLLENFNPKAYAKIDSKFAALHKSLTEIQAHEPQAKVIVFSFFRGTLRYLSERLSEIGIRHVMIHGGISNQDDGKGGSPRRRSYAEFRDDPGVRVMLSSEVGSEGLDFQFANIVVNYDLPWNPMVIEQRIGRIDRIGQEREKLHIYAYVVKDTVDELIYDKLLDKISVFERCVGDLEAIVGSSLSELTDMAFDPKLGAEQRQQQMDQKASALLFRKKTMDDLDEQASKSGRLHDYIRDELQRIRSGGRWLSEGELSSLVHVLLERNELEMNVRPHAVDLAHTAKSTARAIGFFEAYGGNERSREYLRFLHDLRQDRLAWTFNQHVAFKHSSLHLFNARHPAVRILLAFFSQQHQQGAVFPSVGAFVIPRGEADIECGKYLLGQFLANFDGPIRRREMLSVALRLDNMDQPLVRPQQASRLLGLITARPPGLREAQVPPLPSNAWPTLIEHLENLASDEIYHRQEELETDQREYRDRRRHQLSAQCDMTVQNAQRRRDGLLASASGNRRKVEGLVTYWNDQIRKATSLRDEQLKVIDQPQPVSHDEENTFLAYCEVI